MKSTKTILITLVSFVFLAFTSNTTKNVNIEDSVVKWTGYKVTGQHEGTISLKKGTLMFDGKTLTGGKFVMDMTTINTTDIEGDYKAKLDGHLKSNDFFGVKKYNTASLEFISVKGNGTNYNVKGVLIIKGIKDQIEFKMQVSENSATAKLKIDRTKFDIKYGSASFFDGLKDRAIYDEFDLNVNLKF